MRYSELDGLRAILALMVAVCHSVVWLTISGDKILYTYPAWSSLHSISEWTVRSILYFSVGVGTIYSFFVMSGFFLAQKMSVIYHQYSLEDKISQKNAIMKMYRYLISQRITRIYPIHLFIITLISFCLLVFHRSNSGMASDFYNLFYTAAPTSIDYIKNLIFLSVDLNPVGWTLFHELWPFVIVMPVFFVIATKMDFKFDLLNIIVLFLLGQSMQQIFNFPWGMNPFAYLYLFYAGVVLWNKKSLLQNIFIGNPIIYLCLIPSLRLFIENTILVNAWEGFFAIIFVSSVVNLSSSSILLTVLRNKYLTSFGVRTYGFYLIHFPILYFIASLMLYGFSQTVLMNYSIILLLFAVISSISIAIYLSYVIIYPIELFFMRHLSSSYFFKNRMVLD